MEESKLPPGFDKAFILPTSAKDQHGNPVVERDGSQYDAKTGYPFEIWLKEPRVEFVLVPGGEFVMGSSISAAEVARRYGGKAEYFTDEHPQHRVRITKPFYMGKYEVVNDLYRQFKSDHHSKDYKGKSLNGAPQPAVHVSWNEATAFCKWLGGRSGVEVRLPTGAQWEYACRAGTQTPYYWGDELDPDYCNFADANTSVDWRASSLDDGYAVTAPVGRFKSNAFGLYDMLGNVWEWCQDGMRDYSSSSATDPVGPEGGSRVLRGGSWNFHPSFVRSAYRYDLDPDFRYYYVGFRVLLCVSSR